MSLLKHKRAGFAGLALEVVLCFSLAPRASAQRSAASPEPSVSTTLQNLAEEKLRQETIKLQLENQKLRNPWERLLTYGTFVTVLLGVGGFVVTFWKQISENSRQRIRDCAERDRDRQQRADATSARLNEQFNDIVSNLGSKSASIQASAAIQIMNFLKPEHKDFHNQVFLILYANLKVQFKGKIQNEVVGQLLVEAFQKAIRNELQPDPNRERTPIDLARSYLKRADLSNLDLRGADVAFAELGGANLTGSNLIGIRGYRVNLERARLSRTKLGEARLQRARLSGAQLHETSLVAADLKKANLTRAQLQQAKLQSTHFEGANLTDASFEQANLNDAFFQEAILSPASLKSIINALNWDKAHYDPTVLADLRQLAEERSKKKPKG